MKGLRLEIEALEERIAPDMPPGLLGYEGQPGNQGGNPGSAQSHSAVPEVPAGANPQPNP